jgi:hypothetical protein
VFRFVSDFFIGGGEGVNPSETSKSKRQKQKQNECMTNILNTNEQNHNKKTK